jgi:hypothetical protein
VPAPVPESASVAPPSEEEAASRPPEIPRPAAGKAEPDESLLELEAAVNRVPESLRKEMADLLRAEFRQVIRWRPHH